MNNSRIVEIAPEYDAEIANIINQVGAEFGAVGEGYGPGDTEVNTMSAHYYRSSRSLYLIALVDNKVVGGCGLTPFTEGKETCELRKLFLLPEARGYGLGKELTAQCLNFAKEQGFKTCYLETLKRMKTAKALYSSIGFKQLNEPLAMTEHTCCDVWLIKEL